MIEKKILVVDDEQQIRSLIQEAFVRKGYVVRTAESGEEAYEILQHTKFQVIFLDLNMPGMSGVELCKRIRKDFPKVSVFAITGFPTRFEVHNCRKAGFDGYFVKPITFEALLEAAQEAFKQFNHQK